MAKSCTVCDKRSYSDYCFQHKPRKSITRSKIIVQAKPISRLGKQAKLWIQTRRQWIQLNKAALYFCHYCGVRMYEETMTLDHLKPRSRHPELRYVLSNLTPSCGPCNTKKGSLAHDEYRHVCHTALPEHSPALSGASV